MKLNYNTLSPFRIHHLLLCRTSNVHAFRLSRNQEQPLSKKTAYDCNDLNMLVNWSVIHQRVFYKNTPPPRKSFLNSCRLHFFLQSCGIILTWHCNGFLFSCAFHVSLVNPSTKTIFSFSYWVEVYGFTSCFHFFNASHCLRHFISCGIRKR